VLLLALTGLATSADLPKKAPISRYTSLWSNSPFTAKPVVTGPEAVNNPLDDYALIGVSSLGGKKFRVTIINKKKPEEPRIYVESDQETKGFKIVEVVRKNGDPTATTVRMMSGALSGTVSYDMKLLTIAAPVAKAAPQVPGQPPVPGQPQPQPMPNQPGMPQRQPRPRVVPPPTPQTGGLVQPAPAATPTPQDHQNQRPQRRGN